MERLGRSAPVLMVGKDVMGECVKGEQDLDMTSVKSERLVHCLLTEGSMNSSRAMYFVGIRHSC